MIDLVNLAKRCKYVEVYFQSEFLSPSLDSTFSLINIKHHQQCYLRLFLYWKNRLYNLRARHSVSILNSEPKYRITLPVLLYELHLDAFIALRY